MLKENQLEIMRHTYPGFREKDAVIRRVKEDVKKYKTMLEPENKGFEYIPGLEQPMH